MARVAKAELLRPAVRRLVRRHLIPFAWVERFPFAEEMTVEVEGESFVYAGADDDVVARWLYWRGLLGWEPETWAAFLPLARTARGFVDVGAFTGVYTLTACAVNPAVMCVALEPVPRVFARLRENVLVNDWTERVVLANAAAGKVDGTSRFFVPVGALPDTGHLEASARVPIAVGDWVEVRTTRLTTVLPDNFPVDLMKVDVEDAEGPVLRGMSDVIAEHRPALIIELLFGGSHREAADVLDGVGYEYFHLTRSGRVRQPTLAPVRGDPSMNYLCLPRR